MSTRWRHPVHGLPFDAPIETALAEEFAEQPWARRTQAWRKALFRELTMLANGQARRRVETVPAGVSAMLWVYTWTTVGDAIMDLAPRVLVPAHIAIDLLIAPALAPLFASDKRLRHVYTDPDGPLGKVDFVLLDALRSTALRLKRHAFPQLPFATMRGHNAGERFDRAAFADRRLRQLFDLAAGEVVRPSLDLGDAGGTVCDDERFRIAVPIGARVARKRYLRWNEVLRDIVAGWPRGFAAPEFRLMGQGASARKDLQSIDADLVARHGVVEIDSGDLRKAAVDIAACDAFLGVDGGLMHVAVAVGTPGLALFADIDPAYFLRPDSSMASMRSGGDVSALDAARVAAEFLADLARFVSAPRRPARLG